MSSLRMASAFAGLCLFTGCVTLKIDETALKHMEENQKAEEAFLSECAIRLDRSASVRPPANFDLSDSAAHEVELDVPNCGTVTLHLVPDPLGWSCGKTKFRRHVYLVADVRNKALYAVTDNNPFPEFQEPTGLGSRLMVAVEKERDLDPWKAKWTRIADLRSLAPQTIK